MCGSEPCHRCQQLTALLVASELETATACHERDAALAKLASLKPNQ